jgi:small GTP-binding protein
MENSVLEIKVAVVGDAGTGKTCLTHRMSTGQFDSSTNPTVGTLYVDMNSDADDGTHQLFHLWDTAGQEQYAAVVKPLLRELQIHIVCYGIDIRSSFDDVEKWNARCIDASPSSRLVLVGTRGDLVRDDGAVKSADFVTESEGAAKADKLDAVHVVTSAKDGEGIDVLKQELRRIARGVEQLSWNGRLTPKDRNDVTCC